MVKPITSETTKKVKEELEQVRKQQKQIADNERAMELNQKYEAKLQAENQRQDQQSHHDWHASARENPESIDNKIRQMLNGVAGYDLNWYVMIGKLFAFAYQMGQAESYTPFYNFMKYKFQQNFESLFGQNINFPNFNVNNFNLTKDAMKDNGILDLKDAFADAKNSKGEPLTDDHKRAISLGIGLWLRNEGFQVVYDENDHTKLKVSDKYGVEIDQNEFETVLQDGSLNSFLLGEYNMKVTTKLFGDTATPAAAHPTPRP